MATWLDTTLLSAFVSALVSWAVVNMASKTQEKAFINDQINQLLCIAMEYPHVERKEFIEKYSPGTDDDDTLRYENYCCASFNLLERIWKFYKGDHASIQEFFGARELVITHKKWWFKDKNNKDGYPKEFKSYIEKVIRTP